MGPFGSNNELLQGFHCSALLGTFGWGTFAAAIVPAVAIRLNWKRATRAACVASILASIVLNFALELLAKHDIFQLPYGLNVGCFTLLVSLGIFIGVSWMTTRKGAHPLPPTSKQRWKSKTIREGRTGQRERARPQV